MIQNRNFKTFLFSPYYWSIYPIIYFFSHNQNELKLSTIFLPIGVALAATGVLHYALIKLMGLGKGTLFTVTWIVWFFFYGAFFSLINNWNFVFSSFVLGPNKILFAISLILLSSFGWYIYRSKRDFHILNSFLTLIAAGLVVYQLLIIITHPQNETTNIGSDTKIELTSITENEPDIYYIILDMFSGEKALKDLYGFDNSGFIRHLESAGFKVIPNATANYAFTDVSLPSSLNMEYLDSVIKETQPRNGDPGVFYELVNRPVIWSYLKQRGYTIINFSSISGMTHTLTGADLNLHIPNTFKLLGISFEINEFYSVFLKTTALSPITNKLIKSQLREQLTYPFEKIPEIAKTPGKKFVFAHILLPHPPYLFDENGNNVADTELAAAGDAFSDRPHYLAQLKYTEMQTEKMVNELLKNSSLPPVIIIQGDHGPASILGKPENWKWPLNPEGVSERMHILNAYYLPDGGNSVLYPSITPVNSFRVIFNYYFKTTLPLLPDKNFISKYNNWYSFEDVTGKI